MSEPYDEQLLLGYVEGDLTDAQRAQVEQWIAGDPRLGSLLEKLAGDRDALRALPEPETPSALMEDVDRVLERSMLLQFTLSDQEERVGEKRFIVRRIGAIAAAAAMLVVVTSVVIYSMMGLNSGSSTESGQPAAGPALALADDATERAAVSETEALAVPARRGATRLRALGYVSSSSSDAPVTGSEADSSVRLDATGESGEFRDATAPVTDGFAGSVVVGLDESLDIDEDASRLGARARSMERTATTVVRGPPIDSFTDGDKASRLLQPSDELHLSRKEASDGDRVLAAGDNQQLLDNLDAETQINLSHLVNTAYLEAAEAERYGVQGPTRSEAAPQDVTLVIFSNDFSNSIRNLKRFGNQDGMVTSEPVSDDAVAGYYFGDDAGVRRPLDADAHNADADLRKRATVTVQTTARFTCTVPVDRVPELLNVLYMDPSNHSVALRQRGQTTEWSQSLLGAREAGVPLVPEQQVAVEQEKAIESQRLWKAQRTRAPWPSMAPDYEAIVKQHLPGAQKGALAEPRVVLPVVVQFDPQPAAAGRKADPIVQPVEPRDEAAESAEP